MKYLFLLFAATSLLFMGCSNEEDLTGGIGQPDSHGKIGFSFPMNSGGVTYAGTPNDGNIVGSADENVINSVHIYMFDGSVPGSTLLAYQIFSAADLSNNGGKALFDVAGYAAGTSATFYAVANVENSVPAASLSSIIIGYRLGDFQKIISNNTGSAPITTIDPAKGLLMTGYTDVIDVINPTTAEKTINLKRRVARFDISNIADDGQPGNPTGTNFFIQSILISNAKYAGYLTDENSTGASIPSGNLTPISYTGINNGDTESEFYLWPTVLDV
ncbi:fimbrial protein, partial [Dysgonomonas sp. HGC4]